MPFFKLKQTMITKTVKFKISKRGYGINYGIKKWLENQQKKKGKKQ